MTQITIPMNNVKVLASFLRIKLSKDLKSLLNSLPISNFEEFSIGNNIYYGKGDINLGGVMLKSEIKITPTEHGINYRIKVGENKKTFIMNTKEDIVKMQENTENFLLSLYN